MIIISLVQDLASLEKWFPGCRVAGREVEWGGGLRVERIGTSNSPSPGWVCTFSSVTICFLCLFLGLLCEEKSFWQRLFGVKKFENPRPGGCFHNPHDKLRQELLILPDGTDKGLQTSEWRENLPSNKSQSLDSEPGHLIINTCIHFQYISETSLKFYSNRKFGTS